MDSPLPSEPRSRPVSDRASVRRGSRVEATRRLQIAGLLVFLIAASTALRAWAAWPIPGPSTADDDFAYSELGRSVHEVGLMQVIGAPVQFNSLVYPLFVEGPLGLGDHELGYTILKILQALVMSAAAVPVYLWGRVLLGRPWAMAMAAITLAAPALAYSGLLMTEALFYPLVVVAAWASWRALVMSSVGSQALAVAAVAAVTAVRFEAIVLAPAFVAAILLMAVFERDPRRPLRYWPSFLGVAVVGAVWTVWQLDNKSRVSALVGDDLSYSLGEAFLYSRWHLAGLLLITGAVPLCALLLLLVDALRGHSSSRGARAYTAVSSAFACFVLAEVAFFASRHAGTLTERALVSLLPILLMAVPLWVIYGARRPRLQVGLLVLAAFALVASLPLTKFVRDGAAANVISLTALDPLEFEAVGVSLQLGGLLTAGLLLAFAFVPSRHSWTFVVVLFAYLAGISISSSRTLTAEAAQTPPVGAAETHSPADMTPDASMGPLRTLRANPRYFTRDGKRALYVTGSHTWWNLVDLGPSSPPRAFAYDDYLRKLERWGHNFVRLWAREHVRDDVTGGYGLYNNAPHPFVRSGPGTALDGLPKFDLTRLNQAYFDRLRRRVVAARGKGVYVSIMLFEGNVAQFAGERWDWEGHPMHPANNVNGIDGDFNGDGRGIEVHTLRNPEVTRILEAYVRKVVDTIGDLDNVLYEIGNEIGPYSTGFQYHFIDFIRRYERTKRFSHPVGMTYQHEGGSNETLLESSADWISPKDSTQEPTVYPRTKVVVSDSDHHCGATCVDGDWVWRSFTRGQNPIFMDAWGRFRQVAFDDIRQMHARRAMGQTRHYASRTNLTRMHPRPDLCSTGFCLADEGREYIVYQPASGETGMPFEVDLSGTAGRTFAVEWLATFTGAQSRADPVVGGSVVTLTPPFGGSWAVAYLRAL